MQNKAIRQAATSALLIFLAAFIGLSSTDEYLARQNLKKDADFLLGEFHYALRRTRSFLESLPGNLPQKDSCDLQSFLADQVYQHAYLRWVGILADGHLVCASSRVTPDIRTRFRETHPNASFSIAATGPPGAGENLFYIRRTQTLTYMVSISPLHINFLTEFACQDCVDYDFRIEGETPLDFARRPRVKSPGITYMTHRTDDGIRTTLTLTAGRNFLSHYRQLGWAVSGIASLVIALGLGGLIYRFQRARRSMARLIREGIQNSEFQPFYQPIVDSRTHQVVGAEMLARWIRPNNQFIPPAQFIPFAEARGLITTITEQLLSKAVRDVKDFGWADSGLYLSINLVPEHLEDDRGFRMIETLARSQGVPLTCFAVELTERQPLKDLKQAQAALNRFVQNGIDVKIDDAGTGYGGFSYVQELPVSTLKIDKMFIDTLTHEEDVKAQVLQAIITFAKASGLSTVAEGVETLNQVQALKRQGVYHIQGYVYARPMPADEFQAWMAEPRPAVPPQA